MSEKAREIEILRDLLKEAETEPGPVLPALRMFVVRRYRPNYDPSCTEDIYVSAHCLQYSGSVLMCQMYVIDTQLQRVIERTVRAFNSWIDVEAVPWGAVETSQTH